MSAQPRRVSVVLPTYNRSRFLPEAFRSIYAQTHTDWELIVVDDGSTDDTRTVVDELRREGGERVRYVRQENKGAYGARNTGFAHASAELIAFFDSDDLWLPHHLERCVRAFQRNPELDWVYGACRRIDHATGRILNESSFFIDGSPRPFLSLHARRDDSLHIVEDARSLEYQLVHGFYCGLQNSVVRREVFARAPFAEKYRVVEDELFFIRALAEGLRVAYYMEPHVVYRVHNANSSASGGVDTDARTLAIFHELVDGFEELRRTLRLTGRQRRALHKRLSNEYFWHLGYAGHWCAGRRRDALSAYGRALRLTPGDLRLWKSYIAALARVCIPRTQSVTS